MVKDDNDYVTGKVDLVSSDEDGIYLNINGVPYSVDKLDSVFDESYYNAVMTSDALTNSIINLPDEYNITIKDADKVDEARQLYNALDFYTRQYISDDTVKRLETLEKRISEIRKGLEAEAEENEG